MRNVVDMDPLNLRKKPLAFNQSINQSITEPINQSIDQSIIPSMNQSINQSINRSIDFKVIACVHCRSLLTGCRDVDAWNPAASAPLFAVYGRERFIRLWNAWYVTEAHCDQ